MHSTTITWVNKTSKTIKVYWINYDGKRVYYESIAQGETFLQRTWESHPWIVLDSTGACRGFAVAGPNESTYEVR